MKKLLIISLLIGFIIAESDYSKNLTKHNLTIGYIDDRTGHSIFSYTNNFKQTEKNEYFIGVGTLLPIGLMGLTPTLGLQHYFWKSKISISSTSSTKLYYMQVFDYGSLSGFMLSTSLTIEYNLTDWVQIKFGGFGALDIPFDKERDFGVPPFPFFGVNFSY